METKARQEFLKRISTNGFAIEDYGDRLILRPRGAEGTAEITIKEEEPNVWKVRGGSGRFAAFSYGKKRTFFENNLTQWAQEAILRVQG